MLIITRKKGEAINIGNNITIVIIDTKKEQVKIGIDAPPEIDIYRAEIYQAIQNENLKSMANPDIFKMIKEKE